MKKVGDVLARTNEQIGAVMTIRGRWVEIAGEVMALHCEPVMLRKRVLEVMCDSPAWAQQIGMLTRAIEKQIRDITGIRVLKVEGKFGMARKIPARHKACRAVMKPDIDPRDIEKLRDPELAEAVRAFIAASGEGNA
jgi:predicted nucleic acid-binding Zn ribbon protein